MKQTVRIIGGLYRGKKLHFPDLDGLRPTPDRVKETLFNWLMHDIRGAKCLDAFAGSGALGLEAFSRGASAVTFIEQSKLAHSNLKKILTQWPNANLELIQANTLDYLEKTTEQFDVIFLDPPFAQNLIPECLDKIRTNNLLTSKGLVYLESNTTLMASQTDWQTIKLKQNSQVVYGLFSRVKESS